MFGCYVCSSCGDDGENRVVFFLNIFSTQPSALSIKSDPSHLTYRTVEFVFRLAYKRKTSNELENPNYTRSHKRDAINLRENTS